MDRPPPDPVRLLEIWNGWESADTLPGQTLSDLKKHGMADLLAALAEAAAAAPPSAG